MIQYHIKLITCETPRACHSNSLSAVDDANSLQRHTHRSCSHSQDKCFTVARTQTRGHSQNMLLPGEPSNSPHWSQRCSHDSGYSTSQQDQGQKRELA
eukprot:3951899-Pyramimonas_sp.AAC.1